MANAGLKFVISAADATASAFKSALAAGRKFESAMKSTITAPFRALTSMNTMALVSNVTSLYRAFDGLIESTRAHFSASLADVTAMKNFSNITATAAKEATSLGFVLQEAANGALDFDTSIRKANSFFAMGASFTQIEKFFRFASIRAKATGEDFEQILGSLRTGLYRPEMLARLGFVFDKAASKAQKLQQMLQQMEQYVSKSGITGNESAFGLDRMVTAWADIKDLVVDTIGQSPAITSLIEKVKGSLEDLRGKMFFSDALPKYFDLVLYKIRAGVATAGEYILDAVAKIMSALTVPISSLIAKLADKEAAEGFAESWTGAIMKIQNGSTALLKDAVTSKKHVKEVQAELDKLAEKAKNAMPTEEVKKANTAMARAKVAAADWGRGLRSALTGFGGIFAPVSSAAKKASDAGTSAAQSVHEAWNKAADKIKEAMRSAEEAAGRVVGFRLDRDQQKYDVALAHAQNPWQETQIKFARAKELMAQMQATKDDATRSQLYGSLTGITQDLLGNKDLKRFNPKGYGQVASLAEGAAGMQNLWLMGQSVRRDEEVSALERERDATYSGQGGKMFAPLLDGAKQAGRDVVAFGQQLKDLGTVIADAKRAIAGNPEGKQGFLAQWLDATFSSLAAGLR